MIIAFILPYFGKFDRLFPLWLESCRYNKEIDWLVFTDDRGNYNYPPNVKVTYLSFDYLRQRIQSLFDFPIALETPYRFCNFRPAFGQIFEKELEKYDAWGFCDNDMIFGQLKFNFLSISQKFKVGAFGHLSFMPNTEEMKTLFRYKEAYKVAFSNSELLFFDEDAFPKILVENGYSIYSLHIADFMPRLKNHNVLNEPGREWMNKAHCFVWNQGKLWRYFVNRTGEIEMEEYAYIHFLKRPMEVAANIDLNQPIVIVPNRIFNMAVEDISADFLVKVSRPGIFWPYWRNSFKPKNLIERIKNRLYQNKRNRWLMAQMEEMIKCKG